MTEPDAPATPPTKFAPLHRLELWWLRIGVVMLIAFVAIVGIDALVQVRDGASHGMQRIAPEDVSSTPPFDKPGVYQRSDGKWEAIVVAYAFGFIPREDLVVPVDEPIHFRVASVDVVHGYQIPGRSNVNLEVVPGHVSEVTQTFHKPGRYLVLCHEYCGSGHHFMTAHIRVLKRGERIDDPTPLDGAADANKADAMAAMERQS